MYFEIHWPRSNEEFSVGKCGSMKLPSGFPVYTGHHHSCHVSRVIKEKKWGPTNRTEAYLLQEKKVCIVQKRDRTGNMYAMKYVHKGECAERGALKNVAREVEILSKLEHPCLVNLWFSFQDEEDLFMVSDLLLGGDLRYHIQQKIEFSEESIVLFVAEIALALDYLQSHKIVHRDIKPDNILLDEEGHARVTDFNIATELEDGQLATSMSGTKPYIAPEIYMCSCEEYGVLGYGFAVDWWSLGILAWETLAGERPYSLHSTTSYREALRILQEERGKPSHWSSAICDLLDRLLTLAPGARVSTLKELKQIAVIRSLDFDKILNKQIKPPFAPPKDHLNCDPTFELEEMIIEAKPLHKKKKRLTKQRSIRAESTADDAVKFAEGDGMDLRRLAFIPEYRVYNREREMERLERERKEKQWEEELNTAMMGADETANRKEEQQQQEQQQRQQQQQQKAQKSGNRLNVSNVKARISASPRLNRRASTATSSDIDYIDASPEPSTS
ncbi:serine/threonine-protein kinase 32A isoform X1 [Vespa crabro]|uniref:serine/threonine-protein kinase 32A isoform X1 n=2 Tax=Vespa crabro TaxID=7445 RepID=UPI001F0033C0|nr:serine/threonine-protein kinase 32A isoform X1 [Vespa crabro]XP_046835114.1 serine/threonine-protein kinase 32A isoform X1 [Vespa crabro]XP_046835115.1 serine/threonine-protein kinase 32A isoform X1 [Vespa crabro]XP_046835116.1 serine/threonine-protein kinase 32A isoform X1 [Vespa crabro]